MIDDSRQYRYDVCLSFAGEQRAYVEQVAEHLRMAEVEVFYDGYEEADLWGRDLYEHLDRVYRELSRYCVLFASVDYASKVWTTHERRSAQARALAERDEYLLPARFDQTEIPGLRPTVGYVDLTRMRPEELAALIVRKLGGDRTEDHPVSPPPSLVQTPRSRERLDLIAAAKPDYWEYFLFGGELVVRRADLQVKFLDHEMGYARRVGPELTLREAAHRLAAAPKKYSSVAGNLNKVFGEQIQRWAFGSPGEPGDEGRIRHLASRLMEIYEGFLDEAASLRSAMVPEEMQTGFELAARLADQPLSDISNFIDHYVSQVDRIPELLATEVERPIRIDFLLELTVDDELIERFGNELDRLGSES